MKTSIISLIAFLTVATLAAPAYSDELELRVTDMKYTWGDSYDFPVTAYQIGYTKNYGQIGFRIMGGQSDEKVNSKGGNLTNKLEDFFVFSVHRNVKITKNITFQYGLNYTEYKGGSKGYKNSDTGFGNGFAFQYDISELLSMKASYDMYYSKAKPSLGQEVTSGTGLSLVARF
jgi:hypothetical protein